MNKLAPFTEKQITYLNKTLCSWFNVAEGGKRGGKNVLQTISFCINLEEHPSKIHLIAGVSTATARLNILDCDGFGLTNYFEGRFRPGKYQNRDCLYVGSKTGEKVVLISGGGKSGDEKLIKGNTYGMAYVTEANECSITFLKEVFDRTLSSKDRKIFHDLNPKAEGHNYYTDILNFHEQKQIEDPDYGYNYGHFTIADNMSVSDQQLVNIINTYDKKTVWYLREIEGRRKQAEGLIYPNFSDCITKIECGLNEFIEYQISIDYGTLNPISMGLWGLRKGVWYRIKEYYYSGRNEKFLKTDDEYYKELLNLAGDLAIRKIIVDPSAASFITLIRRNGRFRVTHADNTVLDGIRNTATAIQRELIKVDENCKNTIKESELYLWDENSQEDKPIKDHDHAMDDIRYFVQTNKLIKRSTRGEG